MTDRLKVADLPQEEREQLLQRASDAGIKNAMIATWYVDTLEAKIAAAAKPKDEQTPADADQKGDADTSDTDESSTEDAEQDDEQTPADTETPADVSEIDPTTEADDLDEDVEPAVPVVKEIQASKKAKNKKATITEKPQKVAICHICRGKVINGKCVDCGFCISKR